ncbi:LytR/AlgR family response regulator transcription factor [Thermoflexibacter ruber]|uniref:Two component transcriptional regulator, LytTR family n=1 Tax=Thermoflexibacter ruber TaxID=1003 RepID=A0A1I2AG98_9BACT|nr:LytTR family DNA-binding domain-containing protein [Thermoflexibacter ruber]SFE41850.1 two component transcriptional regulator, LytTR family [Thermoflexibacter ruber]
MLLSAIIIDDEKHCREHLKNLLIQHCPEVHLQGTCTSAEEGLKAIERKTPDLVFLDVEMPQMDGFQFLQALPKLDFHIVFTTAFQEYAVQAFKVSALEYLLKPVGLDDLKLAIQKAIQRSGELMNQERLVVALQTLNSKLSASQPVSLPHARGFDFADAKEIIYCQAEQGNIKVCFADGKTKNYTRTLKNMAEALANYQFVQIHRDTVVNLNEIRTFLTGDMQLLLSNGERLHIGRTYLNNLKKALFAQ